MSGSDVKRRRKRGNQGYEGHQGTIRIPSALSSIIFRNTRGIKIKGGKA